MNITSYKGRIKLFPFVATRVDVFKQLTKIFQFNSSHLDEIHLKHLLTHISGKYHGKCFIEK